FELVATKLPHYVLPLYPAIAVLIAGVIDARALSRKPFLVWGTIWWFVVPAVAGVAGIVVLAVIGRQFGLLVWPLMGAAAVMGFLAWRFYQADRAQHALLRPDAAGPALRRPVAAALLPALAFSGLIFPPPGHLSRSPPPPRFLRDGGWAGRGAGGVGYRERGLFSPAGPAPRLADTLGAVEFL